MKKLSTTFMLCILFFPSFMNAQDEKEIQTLFKGNNDIRISGYGAIDVKSTQLDESFAGFLMGARGGMTINNTFLIGAAGYGLIPTKKVDCPILGHETENNLYLTGGYGGLFFEYIHNSDQLFHFTANTLIGFGGITFANAWNSSNINYDNTFKHPSSFVFVLEPGVAVDLNVSKMFRISLGISYRYSPNFSLQHQGKDILPSTAFNGFAVGLSFKFGSFSGRPYREIKEKYTPQIHVPTPTIVR